MDLPSLAATPRQQVLPYGRVVNFSAGPACMPIEVLLEAQQEFVNWRGCGMSIMEMSHRGRYYLKMMEETKGRLASLLHLPQSHHLLFMQGGATLQFAAQPLNMLRGLGDSADYVVTGTWSQYALKEASKFGKMRVAAENTANGFVDLPPVKEWTLNPNAAYVHYCDNETVHGLEFPRTPDLSKARATRIRLTSDMSSNFCSRPIDIDAHALIYAGAQKNMGPAGVTVVIARDDVLGKELATCPAMCSYGLCCKADSALNTPPVFAVYMVGLMSKYIQERGGLETWSRVCEAKAQRLYEVIDASENFYVCPVKKDARSRMNVRFLVAGASAERAEDGADAQGCSAVKENEALKKKFLREAEERGLYHLAGHRALGGCRASLYTGMPNEGVEALAAFMKEFAEENSEA
ncbi:putative phosphoserine aminotransferase [Besnoitia besnoiti]|uniref:phosphoserine transaminase n=1 Tax=Besnoitia besnoiti TaxID=94643 RepID=A0A2A9MMX2_BESBE|nr:putative phosphoserine aminotransferase [Besnoitia besnoiti]PFH37496.1 putative phosphoserine aminotransferase [Besnoitia besnoiti]